MPKFRDIQPFTRNGTYRVNMPWDMLEISLKRYDDDYGLDLDPDFQRAHVWSDEQRTAYVEYILRNGYSSREIQFNSPGWNGRMSPGRITLVDGKQRLEAVRKFMRGELRAFGHYFGQYEDRLNLLSHHFIFAINDLPDRASVLQWYIDLNAGGVVHKPKEIAKVRKLLEKEKAS